MFGFGAGYAAGGQIAANEPPPPPRRKFWRCCCCCVSISYEDIIEFPEPYVMFKL